MASDELIKELEDASSLITSQVEAGLPREDVLESLFRSWAARLTNPSCKFTVKQKASLTSAINSGPWTKDQTKQLALAVLEQGATKQKQKANRTPNQKVYKVENLVTAELTLKMKDTKTFSRSSRCSMFASFLNKLNIWCPDEKSLYRFTAMVAWWEGNWDMDQDEVFKVMDMLKDYLKATHRKDLPFIDDYPHIAAGLPEAIRVNAYGAADLLPPEQDIPELQSILGCNKKRGRQKNKEPEWLKHVPTEYRQEFNRVRSGSRVGGGSPSPHGKQGTPTEGASSPKQPIPSPEVFRFGSRQALSSHQPEPVSRAAIQDQHDASVCEEHGEHLCSRCKAPLDMHPIDGPAGQHGGHTGGKTSGEPAGTAEAEHRRHGKSPSAALDQFEQDLVDAQARRKAATKNTAKEKAKALRKRPASADNPKYDAAGKLILGCSKCVGAPGGCAVCRDPKFGGKRGPREKRDVVETTTTKHVMKAMKVKKVVMKKVMKVAMKKG